MKKQILFAHSAGPQNGPGQGSHDLVSWLRAELNDEYEIFAPVIEHPESPTYTQWKKVLKAAFAATKDPLFLIGHSLGGSVLLKYLSEETPPIAVDGLFLIAVPYWGAEDWKVEEFMLRKDIEKALRDIPAIYLYHSAEDESVPVSHLSLYRNKLKNAVVRELKGYGHEFSHGLPELVKDLHSTTSQQRQRGTR